MIQTKIVIKTELRFSDSDKEFIKNLIVSHFKKLKKIVDIYIEETHGV